MAEEYDDQIPMYAQEDKKEITTHPTGRFGLWEIIDENNATILCDKFFFEYKGLEIPENVRWFFDADESGFYENVDLLLVIDGLEYSANIRKRGRGAGITRMFWGDSLKMEFDSIDRSEPQHVIEFHRAGNNRFELNISGYVRKNRAWLLTWNKDKWNWENYEECLQISGEKATLHGVLEPPSRSNRATVSAK